MIEFSVRKDMKSILHMKGGGRSGGSNTFMSNSNCQELRVLGGLTS